MTVYFVLCCPVVCVVLLICNMYAQVYYYKCGQFCVLTIQNQSKNIGYYMYLCMFVFFEIRRIVGSCVISLIYIIL